MKGGNKCSDIIHHLIWWLKLSARHYPVLGSTLWSDAGLTFYMRMTSSHLLLLALLCACAHAWSCRRCWWCTCAFVFQIFGSVIYSSWVPRFLYRFSLRLKINDTSHIFAFVCQFSCYCCCFVPFVHSSDPSVKLSVPSVGQSVRHPSVPYGWQAVHCHQTYAFIVLLYTIHTGRRQMMLVGAVDILLSLSLLMSFYTFSFCKIFYI